jgi:trehalose-6-phosphate synthase
VQGNRVFAKAVAERLVASEDIVWVHDYHLMLVPKMLRDFHFGPIIFFLHVPFPTSEIFRTLTVGMACLPLRGGCQGSGS